MILYTVCSAQIPKVIDELMNIGEHSAAKGKKTFPSVGEDQNRGERDLILYFDSLSAGSVTKRPLANTLPTTYVNVVFTTCCAAPKSS